MPTELVKELAPTVGPLIGTILGAGLGFVFTRLNNSTQYKRDRQNRRYDRYTILYEESISLLREAVNYLFDGKNTDELVGGISRLRTRIELSGAPHILEQYKVVAGAIGAAIDEQNKTKNTNSANQDSGISSTKSKGKVNGEIDKLVELMKQHLITLEL